MVTGLIPLQDFVFEIVFTLLVLGLVFVKSRDIFHTLTRISLAECCDQTLVSNICHLL